MGFVHPSLCSLGLDPAPCTAALSLAVAQFWGTQAICSTCLCQVLPSTTSYPLLRPFWIGNAWKHPANFAYPLSYCEQLLAASLLWGPGPRQAVSLNYADLLPLFTNLLHMPSIPHSPFCSAHVSDPAISHTFRGSQEPFSLQAKQWICSQKTWIWCLILTFTSCVPLKNIASYFFNPQFFFTCLTEKYMCVGGRVYIYTNIYNLYYKVVVRIKWDNMWRVTS